jgi:hypothetical protein
LAAGCSVAGAAYEKADLARFDCVLEALPARRIDVGFIRREQINRWRRSAIYRLISFSR